MGRGLPSSRDPRRASPLDARRSRRSHAFLERPPGPRGSCSAGGALPIINENDSVSFDEIAFGDNDRLAAMVTNLVDADLLVLVTQAPGFLDEHGTRIGRADPFDPALDACVRPEQSRRGTGGMRSKLESIRMAAERGTAVAIVDGRSPHAVRRFFEGADEGTLFVSKSGRRMKSRAHWIAHTLKPCGRLLVDDGAAAALAQDKSLLPSGIQSVEGAFLAGDSVEVWSARGPIARGLSRYDAEDLTRIMGRRSEEIALILGVSAGAEAIHRDDLVLLASL
ncbi:MAG: glutamate 5-kinase [Myxococcales bacterium]|nr:glutamate 5-kinase [Myxococcales bacterium]